MITLENFEFTSERILCQAKEKLKVLSSGVTGAGFGNYQYFINRYVDKDYKCDDYLAEMCAYIRAQGLSPEETVSMMTAVKLENVHYCWIEKEGFSVLAMVTAGVSNATNARLGQVHPWATKPGTINSWLFVNGHLSEAAYVQSMITAVEAKTSALQDLQVKALNSNIQATGTSTDSIMVAATQKGAKLEFAGPITPLGAVIGQAVYTSTYEAIKKNEKGRIT